MATFRLASARRVAGRLWGWLDASRRIGLNLVFVLLIIALVVVLVRSAPPALRDQTALVLALRGPIVEQRSGSLREHTLRQASGETRRQTQLRDVLDVLDAAAKDEKIERVVLLLDDFKGAGLATLREVAAAIERFKASGKQVLAWGSRYDQRQYYLAAHASEVLLHPMGLVFIEGYGGYRNYYRGALDRIGISANVLRVGTYKSAGEGFTATGPSKESLEADAFVYNALWASYTDGVEHARKLPAGSIRSSIDELPQRFAAARGDTAKLALGSKLVDALKTQDELRALLIERGAKDEARKSFRQVSFDDYLARLPRPTRGDAVGVVVAEGDIIDGKAPPGRIGGLSTAALVRQAREDDAIKAVVLRVDSPGGSVFGSELVRRELELTRAAGKPVVVSMGDLAASGGYWISMASDEVIADPATITGSIGVFALLPTADKALDKLGVHTGGVTTSWLAGAFDVRRPFDKRFADLVQMAIDHHYADFTARAALARKTTPQKIDEVAQGRVWTGAQAKERGLVDRLGSYGDALKSAAARAKLDDGYRVAYVEPELRGFERLVSMLSGNAARWLGEQIDAVALPAALPSAIVSEVRSDLGWLADIAAQREPFMTFAHCLCRAP
jgi:protease IV